MQSSSPSQGPNRHSHSFPPTPSTSLLSRPASRHSRRPRLSSTLPSAQTDTVETFLHRTGHSRHIEPFLRTGLPLPAILNLTNSDLRDDVGIKVLAHRRSLQSAFAAERARARLPSRTSSVYVPEFGGILVHLSNDRTFHSWIRTAGQLAIFAISLLSLAPSLRDVQLVRAIAVAFVAAAILTHFYGVARYWTVMRSIERKTWFYADTWGVAALLVIELAVAGAVTYLVLLDGFVPFRTA